MTRRQQHHLTNRKTDSLRFKLRRFEQAPTYLQGNPDLHSGYRVYLSKAECMASIFKWSNETINIWSHLLGFFLFTGFLIHDTVVTIPTLALTPGEIFTLLFFVLTIMFALGSSSIYHTFSCHSEATYERFLKWDITGIIVSVAGIYAFGLHTALACHEQLRTFYEAIAAVLSVLVFIFYMTSNEKSSASHKTMIVVIATWIAVGIVPPFHLVYLEGGFHQPHTQHMLVQVLVYYALLSVAFFFYLTRYPEKCCPGKVDYIGSSHQLWHLLLLAAFTWWHQAGIWSLERKFDHGCPHIQSPVLPLPT